MPGWCAYLPSPLPQFSGVKKIKNSFRTQLSPWESTASQWPKVSIRFLGGQPAMQECKSSNAMRQAYAWEGGGVKLKHGCATWH